VVEVRDRWSDERVEVDIAGAAGEIARISAAQR
jgi:hypothetical protein